MLLGGDAVPSLSPLLIDVARPVPTYVHTAHGCLPSPSLLSSLGVLPPSSRPISHGAIRSVDRYCRIRYCTALPFTPENTPESRTNPPLDYRLLPSTRLVWFTITRATTSGRQAATVLLCCTCLRTGTELIYRTTHTFADQWRRHRTHKNQFISPPNFTSLHPCFLEFVANQSGHYVWPAAPALSAYLVDRRLALPRGGRCLELGAGCGLAGLVAAQLEGTSAVVFTDHDPGACFVFVLFSGVL